MFEWKHYNWIRYFLIAIIFQRKRHWEYKWVIILIWSKNLKESLILDNWIKTNPSSISKLNIIISLAT